MRSITVVALVITVLFLVVVGLDITSKVIHSKRSSQQLQECMDRRTSVNASIEDCAVVYSSADDAYSDASVFHITSYMLFFLMIMLLLGRIGNLEKKISVLEDRPNV
jgi:hypothetical protein